MLRIDCSTCLLSLFTMKHLEHGRVPSYYCFSIAIDSRTLWIYFPVGLQLHRICVYSKTKRRRAERMELTENSCGIMYLSYFYDLSFWRKTEEYIKLHVIQNKLIVIQNSIWRCLPLNYKKRHASHSRKEIPHAALKKSFMWDVWFLPNSKNK